MITSHFILSKVITYPFIRCLLFAYDATYKDALCFPQLSWVNKVITAATLWLQKLNAVKVTTFNNHDDVIKWKHFPRYWPSVRGIHQSPVNSPHKGQWRGALMFFFIYVWINGWVSNCEAVDLRRYRAHYDVIVIIPFMIRLVPAWHFKVSRLFLFLQEKYWLFFSLFHSLTSIMNSIMTIRIFHRIWIASKKSSMKLASDLDVILFFFILTIRYLPLYLL